MSTTSVVRHGIRSAAELPPAVVLCSCCGATADRLDPPGWVVANPVADIGRPHLFGVCPACLASVYQFTAQDD